MEFEDVTPIMILGETRVIHDGKLLLIVGSEKGIAISKAPDVALVLLDSSKLPLAHGAVISRFAGLRRDRASRFLYDMTSGDQWYGSVFEVSTALMPSSAAAVSVVADSIDVLEGHLILTVEDGLSRPHVFPMEKVPGHLTAVVASLYRHGQDWKLRAFGQSYTDDRQMLASHLGIADAWPGRALEAPSISSRPAIPARPSSAPTPPFRRKRGAPTPSPAPAPRPVPSWVSGPPPLDMARLSALERDTAAVSLLLSDIFADVKETTAPVRNIPNLAGLDDAHASVLRVLMAEKTLETSAFASLTRQYGLMPSGAAETINDWALDQFGEIVVTEEPTGFSFVEENRSAVETLSG